MAELNISSTLLDAFDIQEQIGESNGIYTYHVTERKNGKAYVLKHLSFPVSEKEIEALRYTGAIPTDEDAKRYYEQMSEDYLAQLRLLDKLSESINLAKFSEYRIEPKENGIGFDLYLLSPMRETLEQFLERTPMQHLTAVNLAIDLCSALKSLRESGLIHCNIKPSNVYLNAQGHFMLGDLGLYRIVNLKYASVPERMIGPFSAPELFDVLSDPTKTSDIYSIGLILYNIYNGGHHPFEDEQNSEKAALDRRINGEVLPAPIYADYELTEILLKACAFRPEDRYQTPEELSDAFSQYVERNHLENTMIVPPIVTDADTKITEEAMNEVIEPVQFTNASELDEAFVAHFSPDTSSHAEPEEASEAEPSAEQASAAPAEASLPEVGEEPCDELPPELEANADAVVAAAVGTTAEKIEKTAEAAPAEPEDAAATEPEEPEAMAESTVSETDGQPTAPVIVTEAADGAEPPASETAQEEASEEQPASASEAETNDAGTNSSEAQTDAPPVKPKKKERRFPIWARILTCLAVLILAAGAALYYMMPQVGTVSLKERSTESITLTLSEECTASDITMYATDSYGNVIVGEADGQDLHFRSLSPATQYTFHIETQHGFPVRGAREYTATTLDSIEILYFAAKPVSETQAELNFNPSGGDSESWKVTYTSADGVSAEQVFTGHSVVLTDLKPNSSYTLTLSAENGVQLTGNTEMNFNNSDLIKIKNILITTSATEATVTWEADGEVSGVWTVLCYEGDQKKSEDISEISEAVLKDLEENHDYIVEIYCNGMKQTARKGFRTNGTNLSDLRTDAAATKATVSWVSEPALPEGYSVICTQYGLQNETQTLAATENTIEINGLLPKCSYHVEIRTPGDELLGGTNTIDFSTPEAGHFERFEYSAGTAGLYQHPGKDGWVFEDLTTARTEFAKDETIAFAVESGTTVSESADTVAVLYVIRDSEGRIVSHSAASGVWNELWTENRFVGEVKHHVEEAGTYTLEIYFDGLLLTSQPFKIA